MSENTTGSVTLGRLMYAASRGDADAKAILAEAKVEAADARADYDA